MTEKVILLIGGEADRAGPIARELERACDRRVEWVAVHDGVCRPGGTDGCALVLFWLERPDDYDPLVETLWRCSTSPTPVPLVALSQRYDEAQALACFRIGVTDYLSLADHLDVLPDVVGTLLAGQADDPSEDPPGRPVRGGKVPRTRPALNH